MVEEPVSASQRIRALAIPLSELATANRQRDALYLLSERLHRAESLEDIHDAAMDAIGSALDCDRAAILLFDDAGVMRFVASRGLSPEYRAAVTGHSPWRADQADATPIAIPDVACAELADPLRATVLGEGIRAVAFVPLVADGALIGKFMAYFRAPREFSPDDLNVSLAIARQLAFAIERERKNAQLRANESQLADELAATRMLQELSIEIAHEADVEGLYRKLLDAARLIARADCASMQQFIPHMGARGELKLIGHHGFSDEAARFWAWVRPNASSVCGLAMTRLARVVIEDIEQAEFIAGTAYQAQLLAAGIRAVQSTPLLSRGGELVGIISTHWKTPHAPSQQDLRLLDILARLAADLIERKTQDEELRRREERLRALTQLLTDVPWEARPDGSFARLQPAWENYTGQSWDAHAGHGWFEAVHAEDRDAVQASWLESCFDARPYEQPARLWHAASQSYRACTLRATPIRNEDGTVREWVGACIEIHGAAGGNA